MIPPVLTTARLTLRPVRLDDVHALYEYAQDEEWGRFLPTPLPYRFEDAVAFVARGILADRARQPGWIIDLGGRPIGDLVLRIAPHGRTAELGYALGRAHWGKGIMVEAASAILAAAFEHLPELHRIEAFADPRNTASTRVMEKLGMSREGVLRQRIPHRGEMIDVVFYAVLREEGRP